MNSVRNKKWRALLLLIALLGGYFAIKSLSSFSNKNDLNAEIERVRELARSGATVKLAEALDRSVIRIPAGEFTMGSSDDDDDEKPPHRVRITKPFYLGKYEVTQEQWEAVMGTPMPTSCGTNGAF